MSCLKTLRMTTLKKKIEIFSFHLHRVIEALNVASFTVLAAASFLPEYVRARISASLTFHIKNQIPLIDNLSENGIQQVKMFCYFAYLPIFLIKNCL